ncbi:Sensor histidine kinase CssS [uncultured Clostridium sp.]|nr:Sensor histidine kinase CssS [uncultured Clostridium sp.]
MKSTLYLKFIILYIIFGFLSIFATATLSPQLIKDRLEESTSQTLFKEAHLISNEYLPSYFSGNMTSWSVHSQLTAMKLYLGSSLWFVDKAGVLITSSNLDDNIAPETIEDFDPAEIGNNQYIIGDYHGYFDEDVITVMAPVTQGFATKGYLLIHSPISSIDKTCQDLMFTIYITLLVIYILSFIFLLGFHFFIFRPLAQVTEAAKQYALGNLDYEIPVYTHDEMGYLSASLNYMSSQLKDMEDYQKKFVANVSHDFRSPLTSIKGYVEAMTDGTIPPELHEKYLKIILFETERLTDLTKDLLTLNEFDTQELLLDKTAFDIQDVIKNTAAASARSSEGICR